MSKDTGSDTGYTSAGSSVRPKYCKTFLRANKLLLLCEARDENWDDEREIMEEEHMLRQLKHLK